MAPPRTREAVLEAARGWLGTKFEDHQRVKGAGVDCAHLLVAVFHEAGFFRPPEIEHYSPQFMLHRDDPLFEQYVVRLGGHVIAEADAAPGDIVLYRIGRSFAHGAIISVWPKAVIHAFKPYGFVAETAPFEAELLGREVKFYSAF